MPPAHLPAPTAGPWLLGVYDADGGWRGEARYVVGSLLGRAHCALCDITHSPVRRKREWDRLVAGLGVPVRVVHRNEVAEVLDPELARQALSHRLAAVFLVEGTTLRVLVSARELAAMNGSVAAFGSLVATRLPAARLDQGPGRPSFGT